MDIRKIGENVIRFLLNQDDLSARNISLNELAYGSENATRLFAEMLALANSDYGFDSEGAPLMVEAIPMEGNSLALIITKTEDPEELDPRFSKFAPVHLENAPNNPKVVPEKFLSPENTPEEGLRFQIFTFPTLDSVIFSSKILAPIFQGHSQLYKNSQNGNFYLVLHREAMDLSTFQRIGNKLSEYSQRMPNATRYYAYLSEHQSPIMEDMLADLAKL